MHPLFRTAATVLAAAILSMTGTGAASAQVPGAESAGPVVQHVVAGPPPGGTAHTSGEGNWP